MRIPWSLLAWFLLHNSAAVFGHSYPAKRSYHTHNYYLLEHNPFHASLADVALELGVEVVEQVGELRNHWLVKDPEERPSLEVRDDVVVDRVLARHSALLESRQDMSLSRRSSDKTRRESLLSSIKLLSRQTPRQRVKRTLPIAERQSPESSPARAVATRLGIEDPLFPDQWHFINEEFPEHTMNVIPVWEMGFTGKGIITSLVDDGLDYNSTDLKGNIDLDDSYDFNDHEPLPTPKLFDDHHGTRCAGQVAAGRNAACGVGIAYEGKVAGVRILSGPITDVDEAAALNYGFQNVSIYSCSWGPPDNGQSMEGPSNLIQKAVVNGINNGRAGKGSVFVFASGNGAAHGDQCNFDGYTNSIYSVTVSAVDYKGLHPYYSEPCAANMIVAYSSGSGQHIVTTDRGEDACATTHGGTSAAAPNAVGVFALALEARPDLTWRDIQYLCVKTAKQINPEDTDWEPTAPGGHYSYKYGFGVLDAFEYVKAAQEWTLVKPQAWYQSHSVQLENGTMAEFEVYTGGKFIEEGGITSSITVTADELKESNFELLEHIQVRVWIKHGRRGDVEVELISPSGVKSVLGGKRDADHATSGYPGWIFMTVKHWGESAIGDWTLRVADQHSPVYNGSLIGWNMMFWGSSIDQLKATKYELPPEDVGFPPDDPTAAPEKTPTTTTQHSKPTAFLTDIPEVNTDAPLPSGIEGNLPQDSATSSPTADEGWFSDMGNLVTNQKWFFGAIAAVAVFAIGAAIFFWRRRVLRLRSSEYETLPLHGNEVEAVNVGGRPGRRSARTKELYDAFGEVSDDDDDADEKTQLQPGSSYRVSEGIGYHSAFLDDDDEGGRRSPGPSVYKDEPDSTESGERTRQS